MGQQQLLIILMGIIIIGAAIAIGITLYGGQSVVNNKDNLLNSLTYISGDAFAYYQRANIMGGGSGSFLGYKPPRGLQSNDDGVVEAYPQPGGKSLVLIATSRYGYGTLTVSVNMKGELTPPIYTGRFFN